MAGDFITSDGFAEFAAATPGVVYSKRDFLFRSGVWRGKSVGAYWRQSKLTRSKTLITGHSDLSLSPSASRLLRLTGVSRIFGGNVLPWRDFASPIPIGLTNDCDDSPLHRLYGDNALIVKAWEGDDRSHAFKGSIYVNFTTSNALRERSDALRAVRNLSHVTIEKPEMTPEGRLRFLERIRQHDFVLAPPGNGIDTHRFWESLYLGAIPITKRTPIVEAVARNLPCVLVDRWDELTEPGFLEAWYADLDRQSLDARWLGLTTWIDVIRGSRNG